MRRIETRDGRVFVHEPKCPWSLIRQSFIEALEQRQVRHFPTTRPLGAAR